MKESMKKISILIPVFFAISVFGQKVSDYKYILVPGKFKDFEKKSYGLEEALAKALKAKRYIIVPNDREQWPSEINGNSCDVIIADLKDDSSLLRNKVKIEFKDCNDKILFTSKGNSNIKEFEEGFQDALKQALIGLPSSVPLSNPVSDQTKNIPEEKEVSLPAGENKIKKYINGKLNLTLQKIQIDASQFILVDAAGTAPYATFGLTSKKDVFRVKLANGSITVGYFENGDLVIDIPSSDGSYSKEIFSAK